jgi:hypothetical protein
MLTGRRVFQGEDVSRTLAEVMKSEPKWTALPALPLAVEMCLRQSLKKAPRQRRRDIGEMRLALDGAFDTLAVRPGVPGAPASTAPVWRRVLPWAAGPSSSVRMGKGRSAWGRILFHRALDLTARIKPQQASAG